MDAIGEAHTKATTEGIIKAWKKIADLSAFSYRRGVPPNPGAARTAAIKERNRELIKAAVSFRPDLVHMGKCEIVYGGTVEAVKRETGAKIAHFYGDWRASVQPWVVNIGRHADVTMFQHKHESLIERYLKRGVNRVEWWWAGADPEVFKPYPSEKIYPIVFMANLAKSQHAATRAGQGTRLAFVKHLASRGLHIHLFGKRAHMLSIKNVHPHGFVEMEGFARVCSKGKIALSFGAGAGPLYASSPRIVKTMACGTMLLTHHIPGLETLFGNYEHLVWYEDFDDAARLAKHYLGHDDERERIAARGRAEVLRNHTWDARVRKILDYVGLQA